MNEKAKTTNNGSFLKLFKTLTAHVLSSLKILRLRPQIFKLDKKHYIIQYTPGTIIYYIYHHFPLYYTCTVVSLVCNMIIVLIMFSYFFCTCSIVQDERWGICWDFLISVPLYMYMVWIKRRIFSMSHIFGEKRSKP